MSIYGRTTRYNRGALRVPCLQYIHFMGIYHPFETNLGELLSILIGAAPDLVDQCQIDVAMGLKQIAEERGVPTSQVVSEFRSLMKELPSASDLVSMSNEEATRRLVASHRQLQRDLLGVGPVVASINEGHPASSVFGGTTEIVPIDGTRQRPLKFMMGGYEVGLTSHAVKRMRERLLKLEDIAEVLSYHPSGFYRPGRSYRLSRGGIVVCAFPTPRGWTVKTVYRQERGRARY